MFGHTSVKLNLLLYSLQLERSEAWWWWRGGRRDCGIHLVNHSPHPSFSFALSSSTHPSFALSSSHPYFSFSSSPHPSFSFSSCTRLSILVILAFSSFTHPSFLAFHIFWPSFFLFHLLIFYNSSFSSTLIPLSHLSLSKFHKCVSQ